MKKSFLLFMLIFISFDLFAAPPQIAPQRMITDYNGIAYNEDIILCYGNYGIITFSRDLGENWYRVNIGDKHNIKKILFNDNRFYGISDYHLLVSDDGIVWNISALSSDSDIIDFSIIDENFYFLKEDGVFILKNNTLNKIYDLDEKQNYFELLSTSEFIFILKNKNTLIRIELKSGTKNEFIIPYGPDNYYKSELKYFNNILYARTKHDDETAQSSLILSSIDNGETWNMLNQYMQFFSTYLPLENEILLISEFKMFLFQYFDEVINSPMYYQLPYLKSFDLKNLEINDITEKKVSNPFRNNKFAQTDIFSDLKKINDSIYVVVGRNNSIILSKDNGKSWETVSNCKNVYTIGTFNRNRSPYVLDKNIVLTNNYYSDDGFITFKPRQLYAEDVDILPGGTMQNYYFDSSGTGMILYNDVKSKTTDYGKSFKFNKENSLNNESISFFQKGIKVGDKLIFTRYFDYFQTSPYTKLYFYDDSYNLTDSTRLDSILLKPIF